MIFFIETILLLQSEHFVPGQGEAVVTRKLERDVPLKIPENPKPPDAGESVKNWSQMYLLVRLCCLRNGLLYAFLSDVDGGP